MAAVDPSESPNIPKSPAEEGESSGQRTGAEEQRDETTHAEPAESPDREQGASAGNDGGCAASHSGVRVASGAGAGAGADTTTTCSPPEDLTLAGKMAEAAGGEQRAFDWSETEDDDEEAKTQREEDEKCDPNAVAESAEKVQQDTNADNNIAADAKDVVKEENSDHNKGTAERKLAEELVGKVDSVEDAVEDDEEAGRGGDADLAAKPKKCRLVCKECGKRFNRRETFNLHRHFHAHEDELMPLTCKECGLSFQHRSSLIKHRNEHKEKEEQLVTPKKEVHATEEQTFECAECRRIFFTVDKLRDHNCSNTVEKPYHCPLCRQEFQFKVSVTKHMMTHSQESMFTCHECNQTFPNTMALRYHQRCHTALKPYECPECGMVFKHYSVMEDHRRKHSDNPRSHLCNICGKTFKYSSLLHQHQYLHTGQKPFRCPECGKNFAFAQNMKAHCRQHRLRETNSSSEQPCKQAPVPGQEAVRGLGKENAHQREEPKRTFKCPLCPQTYCVPAHLRTHMLIHEAEYEKLERTPRIPREINKYWEKGHSCPHCPCVYRDESSLNVHLLSVHKSVAQYLEKVATPPKKQCNVLSSDNVQGKWRNDGTSVKSYKCSECGKNFRHRSVLELHMRIHSKDKPYQCKVCGKGFRFSSYLQQHLIIHTGKKPYKCPDCGKDFAFLQNMKTHQKLHQEKPFRCTSCRKGYSDETQLQHHMLSHSGDKPHKCELCEKSFGLAYLLRDHMNTHTGERPHRCDECHKTFSWFSSLLVHQKIHTRKRQGFSQYNSLPIGARMRGRGSRGRRGGRLVWSWSRPLGSAMINAQPSPFPVSSIRETELHRRAIQPESSMLSSRMDLQSKQQKEPWMSKLHSQPVQWKVDGGEVMLVPSSQQAQFDSLPQSGLQQHHHTGSGWADSPLITQSGPNSAQTLESSHMKESTASIVSSNASSAPKKSSPLIVSELEQQRQVKPATWNNATTSTALASTSSLQHDFSVPSAYIDGAALWSVRPAHLAISQSSPNKLGQELQLPRWPDTPVSTQKEPSTTPKREDDRVWDVNSPQVIPSTVSQPEKPWNGCEPQKQWASGLASASTSAQIDQRSAMPISTSVSLGVGSTLWDAQKPPGIPKTVNSPEKLVNNQDLKLQPKQVSSGWASVQSQTATQKVPISIQYEPHRFGQGMGTPVWGFQSNPSPQTLLTGQLKPGNGQELKQQPMAVMSERPHMPQTLPLPQLTPQTEPHKLGSRLPFAPERLLQCMICGCSLPRELDLQMHYLQHAQGEI
ncbi:uncharacterized protein LOC115045021 isoform X2 [Echeneis naucrates]|uniref:uncharacterized protein LOC115045021 isoform X2 n=1 Tax=Echeneis naucrates TaxID=173247 RepID=UPI001113B009|nr:uncharacterized protein LOC115045021 isoform X2 [Echeneis naucrates]